MDELSLYNPNEIYTNSLDVIKIDDLPPYEIQDYDVFNEKDFKKYVNDVKKTVRNSLEYRQYIQYLRNYMNLNEDSFFENINNMDNSKVKIEIGIGKGKKLYDKREDMAKKDAELKMRRWMKNG